MVMDTVDLNQDQIESILAESLSLGYWELDAEGNLPRDPQDRAAAASELIRQCALSHAAGNRSDGVVRLLNIAEAGPGQSQGEEMAATETVDLSEHNLESLQKFEEALLGFPQGDPEVIENLALVRQALVAKGGMPSDAVTPAPVPTPTIQPDPVVAEVIEAATEVDRAALEDQLTFKIMREHKIDPSMVDSLSVEDLQWILSHAAPEEESVPTAEIPSPEPENVPPVAEAPDSMGTTVTIQQPDPEPEPVAPSVDEREELEGQVTGPILKKYGRGRLDVPGLGDNELRFMIEHPDGKVTPEQLAAAQALDAGGEATSESSKEMSENGTMVYGDDTEATPGPVKQLTPEMRAALFPNAGTTDTIGPVDYLTPEQITAFKEGSVEEVAAAAEEALPDPPARITRAQALSRELPENPAQEVIDQEHFPVPPEIDGNPPKLPFDMSTLADDELRSLHAQMHAVHSRANVVVGLWEGELREAIKDRKTQEVAVANALPTKDPEDARKRLTDAQRESMIAADPLVVQIKQREHEVERVLRQLRVLRDGYASDVSTCSRQWAMRKEESAGASSISR